MLNEIFLRRKNKVWTSRKALRKATMNQIATIQANIEPLGYVLGMDVAENLANSVILMEFSSELISILSEMKGVKDYNPTYPNFPEQVMEMGEAELYMNSFIQYFHDWAADITGDRSYVWLPKYDKKTREPLKDKIKLKVIGLGTENEFRTMMHQLISSNTSISDQDKKDIKYFLLEYGHFDLPESIPHKEILGFVGALAIESGVDLSSRFKTATDVLRLATAMSDGDVSLATNTKYRNFKRPERKYLLNLLEKCGSITEDVLRHEGKWIRLGEKLHPGERKDLKNVNFAFDVIRNGKPYVTFNSKIESLIKDEDVVNAVKHLSTRPGLLARRLDQLMRTNGLRNTKIVGEFAKVASEVSTPVLLQVRSHFMNRMNQQDLRVFFPKGNLAKAQAIKNELEPLAKADCIKIVARCDNALVERFSKLPKLGKCKIDECLKECLVPFSQRSASKSLRTIVRGSRLPFGSGGNTIRFFIYWKEKSDDRTDLDLSAVFFDEKWQMKSQIAYYNLKDSGYKACHSGDQTSAPNGACEFIDLDIPSSIEYGGRYVVMNVNCFTHQKFSDLPECHAGWMIRQHPKSGEIFEPKTVLDRLDVRSESTFTVPMILDLQERKIIWVDTALKANARRNNNVHNNMSNIALFGKAFTELQKPNLYDLFSLHVLARGELIDEGRATKHFTIEDAFQVEKIMSEYLK